MSATPVRIHELAQALGSGNREVVALVGGGGKTTALFALGRQLSGSVILSTTTKMGSDRTGGHRPLIDPTPAELSRALDQDRVALCWRKVVDHRAEGFSGTHADEWRRLADHIVVEADGSRRRPFKAPAAHEPVVPSSTTVLVACVGAAAFDAPIAERCHRPEIVASIAGCVVSEALTPRRLATVILSDQGSRKSCPADARFFVLLNRVTDAHASFVDELGEHLGEDVPVVAVAPFAPEDSPEAQSSER